ncbi:MAG: hypothetical protein ACXAC7_20985 [Candidatus Hodarchaeales archaeon]|jgi:hypothetical protein
MKAAILKQYNLIFLIVICYFSIALPSHAQSSDFYPPEGTTSKYLWSFDGFKEIYALNGSHIDYDNLSNQEVLVENPIKADFTVSYSFYDKFVEETVKTIMINDIQSLSIESTFLINITTRQYVNEAGVPSNNYGNGYINPNEVSIGTEINVSSFITNVTRKESLTIADVEREAWFLELKKEENEFSLMNVSLYFDQETGILLKVLLETVVGTIGDQPIFTQIMNKPEIKYDSDQEISYSQVLIETNAWDAEEDTATIPLNDWSWILISLGLITVIFRKFNNKIK